MTKIFLSSGNLLVFTRCLQWPYHSLEVIFVESVPGVYQYSKQKKANDLTKISKIVDDVFGLAQIAEWVIDFSRYFLIIGGWVVLSRFGLIMIFFK